MIKRLPGWLNYIILWAGYFVLGLAIDHIGGFKTDHRFIAFFCAFYSGSYLAKWRFDGTGWHFW